MNAVNPIETLSPIHRPAPRSVVAASLAVIAFSLLLRAFFLTTTHDGDMELFVYMGKLVTEGGHIGVDLLDNKLPTVGLLMAGPYLLFGGHWIGYGLMSFIGCVVSIVCLARVARLIHPVSTWPTAAMAAVWLCFPVAVFSPFKLEHVQVTLASVAALATVRCFRYGLARDAIVLGLCSGVAMLAKPSGLAVMMAAAVGLAMAGTLTTRRRLVLAVWAMLGLAIPVATCAIYFLNADARAGLMTCIEQVRDYNRNSIWIGDQVIVKLLSAALLLGIPLALRAWVERRQRLAGSPEHRPAVTFAIAWLTLELAAVVMQGRMYGYHFLTIMPPAALLFGLILRLPRAMSVVGAAAPVLIVAIACTISLIQSTTEPIDRVASIDYVKSQARTGDEIWMDDLARVLVESDNLHAGSRLPLTFIFANTDKAPQQFGKVLLDDLATRRPRWVIVRGDLGRWVDFHRTCQVEFARSPARGENLKQTWDAIDAFVTKRYTLRSEFGPYRVMELAPSTDLAGFPKEQ